MGLVPPFRAGLQPAAATFALTAVSHAPTPALTPDIDGKYVAP